MLKAFLPSPSRDLGLSKAGRETLTAAKIIWNSKGVFLYPPDILARIEKHDESVLVRAREKEKDEGKV